MSRIQRLLHMLVPEAELSVPETPASPTPHPTSAARPAGTLWDTGYWWCYLLGLFACRVGKALWGWLITLLTPVWAALRRLWVRTAVRFWRRLTWEWARVKEGFVIAKERLTAARQQSLWRMLLTAVSLPFAAARRHRGMLRWVWQAAALTLSVVALLVVLHYWRGTTFALELVYGGSPIGYIADEAVFTGAVNMAESRVIKTESTYVIQRDSYMTLRPVQESRVLSESELCDEILRRSGSEVEQMSGLYIDDNFEGALPTHARMQQLLDAILAQYDTQITAAEKTAEFMSRVEIVDGLYPVGAGESYDGLFSRLTRRDADGIPYLPVQIRCKEVYEESIPYGHTTLKDASKYINYSAIATPGEEGILRITADVIYLNGKEQYREILDERIIKQPVDEVTVIGAYRVNANAVAGVPTGQFMWPLPSCHTVWSPFGYRWGKLHAGIDISGNGVFGKDILASDGGVVREINTEGWGGGYGLYVIVDHGNGYTTMYAHCSQILVQPGQKVAQGELIALVGSTGDSQGPHLHFEIRMNGVATDPVPYIK